MPDPNTHKNGNSLIYNLPSNILEITASPNPANSWVAFNYTFAGTSENAAIEIHNAMGELVHRINLTTNHGQEVWDTRSVIPGFYLFSLKSSGLIKSGKLIITN